MSHTIEATAWTLIHFCWQAALTAGVYRVVMVAIAHRSSQARYLVALSALMAMLATAVCTFAWQMRSDASSAMFAGTPSVVTNARIWGDFPRAHTPDLAAAMQPSPGGPQLAGTVPRLMNWIDAFWMLGVLALSLRGMGGWWLIRRLRLKATSEAPDEIRAAFRRVSRALGLTRPALLRVSNVIAGPVTVGALRAMVLLPMSAVTLLGPDELEVVLAHELAHVRRADFLWNLIQTLVETLFFFHPAMWWVSGQVRQERELCCDDLALSVCPNPVVYASALFHLEEQRSRQMSLAMALDGHQSRQKLRMRIARILGESMPRTQKGPVRPFSAAAVLAALIVLLLPAPQVIASLRPSHSVEASVITQPTSPSTLPAIPTISSHVAVSKPHPGSLCPVARARADMEAVVLAQAQTASPAPRSEDQGSKSSYIERMKAAGYDVDLDKMIAMKIQNVTPEYARAMAQLGFGKLSADDLIACKIQGVTAEAIAEFKKQGLEVKSIQDAISYRIFEVTPEFAAGMKAAGFKDLDSSQLLTLRVQGITPEYARSIVQQYPGADIEDVIKTRIFRIDAEFIASAKKHGFTNLSLDKLVQLRISGLLENESVKP